MAGLLVLITDVNALGLKAAQGLLLTTSFYWDMDDKTREWSKRYFAKMNQMPTMWQAGVYSSVMNYLNAIKAAGTDDPLKVAAKMREKPIEDFFARNGKLREDGLMVHDLVLVQVKTPEESKYPVGLLQDPRAYPRRAGVRAARSGLPAGQEVTVSLTTEERRIAGHRGFVGQHRGRARHALAQDIAAAVAAIDFDLKKLKPGFLDDPYPTYRALRQHRSDSPHAGRVVFLEPLRRLPRGLSRYRRSGARTRSSISARTSATASSTSITLRVSFSTIRPITRGCANCSRPPSRRGRCARCSTASKRWSIACSRRRRSAARSI